MGIKTKRTIKKGTLEKNHLGGIVARRSRKPIQGVLVNDRGYLEIECLEQAYPWRTDLKKKVRYHIRTGSIVHVPVMEFGWNFTYRAYEVTA